MATHEAFKGVLWAFRYLSLFFINWWVLQHLLTWEQQTFNWKTLFFFLTFKVLFFKYINFTLAYSLMHFKLHPNFLLYCEPNLYLRLETYLKSFILFILSEETSSKWSILKNCKCPLELMNLIIKFKGFYWKFWWWNLHSIKSFRILINVGGLMSHYKKSVHIFSPYPLLNYYIAYYYLSFCFELNIFLFLCFHFLIIFYLIIYFNNKLL